MPKVLEDNLRYFLSYETEHGASQVFEYLAKLEDASLTLLFSIPNFLHAKENLQS